jgi:centrosomal protein CEP350
VDRGGGDRLSPDSLQRKLTAEINLLENVEDSVRQVSDIERTRAISLAQQETVSLAQILKVIKST